MLCIKTRRVTFKAKSFSSFVDETMGKEITGNRSDLETARMQINLLLFLLRLSSVCTDRARFIL